MRLKSLEVQGYKSFANKVELVFDSGITAVVGPNGSGKSNVADAIRWVLGEQSYRSLRGKKTEDMIFSGSDGRARLGMATATLVLDNTDRWIPLDFSEVTISRRAYRSGENEYFLNGSRVRLKDVYELLSRGGLSRQTYTVIGQGMIDQVLGLQAEERRMLFEEAAGITFHRQKRLEALNKLQATQDNLLRLNDIVQEIAPQLRRLEKQAERAEEYRLIKTHLEGLLRIWYGYRWGRAQQALRDALARQHQSQKLVKEQRDNLQEMSLEIDVLRTEQADVRTQLSQWYAENNQLNKRAESIQRELAVNEERARQYAAQRQEILAELEPLATNLAAQADQVAQVEADLNALVPELTQAEQVRAAAQARLAAHQTEQEQLLAQQEAAAAQLRQLATALTQRETRLHQLAERQATLQAEQDSRVESIRRFHEQQQELQARQSQTASRLQEIEADSIALESEQRQQRDHLTELSQQVEQIKTQIDGLSRREGGLKARLDVLDKLRSDMSGYYAGVRAVMEAGLPGVVGTVSQVLQVPPELEVAIEAALGGRLQDVVVERFKDAEAAIAHLKQARQGRATLLPLETIRAGTPLSVPNTPGVIGLASDLVTVAEDRLRAVAVYALGRTLVVEDLPAARRAFEALQGGFQIVTREGELMRSGGSVTGGASGKKGEEGTFLAREREWRALPAEITTLQQQQAALSTRLAGSHDQSNALKQALQSLAERLQHQQQQRREMQTLADKLSRSLEQVANSLQWHQDLQAKSETELSQIDQRQTEDRQQLEQLSQARIEAEAEVKRLADQAQTLSAEQLLADLNEARSAVAAIQARQANRQAMLDNYQAARRQLSVQIESKRARAEALAAEREALLGQQTELQSRTGGFAEQLGRLNTEIEAGEQKLAELEARQIKLQQDERQLRQRVQRLELEHNRLSLDAARCQDELDHMQRQIHDDLGLVQLEMADEQIGQPILPVGDDLPTIDALPPGVEEDVQRLKVQIRRMGNINFEAPQEYADLKDRHEFLSAQITDLEAAITDLRAIIAKLDETMVEAFVATFEQVAKEFQRYFKTLFGGGEAQLILTDPNNMLETGVDIVARPPGKRLQNLGLLSGGERSLTAQALIFALLRISPTPFVIFDEVDAMLDEANVSRFRDALKRLAQDIQFIVITHNRTTIEAANTLYGVSMGDDSVSQVFSLKIDEWLAERKNGQ